MDAALDGRSERIARTARLLAYAGLLPFLLLAIWLAAIPADHIWRDGTIFLLKAYAATILSFLGGVRWGVAMTRHTDESAGDMLASAAAPLLGWLSVATPAPYAFALLAVAFAAHGAWDTLAAHRRKTPDWYARLRIVATSVVVATMILAFVATG